MIIKIAYHYLWYISDLKYFISMLLYVLILSNNITVFLLFERGTYKIRLYICWIKLTPFLFSFFPFFGGERGNPHYKNNSLILKQPVYSCFNISEIWICLQSIAYNNYNRWCFFFSFHIIKWWHNTINTGFFFILKWGENNNTFENTFIYIVFNYLIQQLFTEYLVYMLHYS